MAKVFEKNASKSNLGGYIILIVSVIEPLKLEKVGKALTKVWVQG